MRITDVQAYILQGQQKYENPSGAGESPGVFQCCLIRVETDEGIVGWSDVETQPAVAKACVDAPDSGSGLFEGLRSLCVGEDPFETERLWDKMYQGSIYFGRRGAAIQAMSGIDIACWDIIGKATRRPLWKLLGGAHRKSVRAYASTLFRPTPEDMRQACSDYLKHGFSAIKFGWGVFGQDRKLDEALVRAARKEIGDNVELLVDPGWKVSRSAFDALETARMLAQYHVFWMEDFLNPEDYEGYRRVSEGIERSGLGVRVAAGEQEATAAGFRRLISEGRIHVAQPDISRCGGISVARKIVWMVREHSIDLCPHAWLTDLLTAASLHVNAILPRALFLEYNVSSSPMLREVISNPVKLNPDGTISVPEGPGLGIQIDEKAVKKFRVA